jgi:tRNA A-37 threonylcarbamoyl transferase component Bud32/tetratricopeptide (TPR) repeat protein
VIVGDRFELVTSVGRGAFAEVHRATDLRSGKPVAIKWLHAEHQFDRTARDRFAREVRLLERVHSEHVVRLVASGEQDSRPWMALQWLEGSDLSHLMARERIAPHIAVEIVRQAALGLSALHQAAIVHRDMKPSNFFVHMPTPWPKDLHVTLIDLGVARAPTEKDITLDGMRVGTPSYMSPEQARGEERLAPQSDLYSLAVVLYELLSGKKPFIGSDPFAVLARIVLEDPQPLESLAPDLSTELCRVVSQGMSRDPHDRFASAQQMAAVLAAITDVPTRPSMPGDHSDERTAQLRTKAPEATFERRVVTTVVADLRECANGAAAAKSFQSIHAEHGGFAQNLLGRRALALFGVAKTSGDEAVRAAQSALAFIHDYPDARVAIVTARTLARGGTASLDALERFSGELTRAKGLIAVDEETARALQSHFVTDGPLGAQVLRGERASHTAVSTRLLGREVPFVGREREVSQLLDAYQSSARAKSNGGCLLLGGAGIGKSRLRLEFLRRLERSGVRFAQLVLRCDPMLRDVPYAVIGRALRHRAMIELDDHESVRRAALSRWARSMGLSQDIDTLESLTGFEPPASAKSEDADVRRERTHRTIARIFAALGAVSGDTLVLQIEDLQWLDDASVNAVQWALEGANDSHLFVLGLGRPELTATRPQLWEASLLATIQLAPLIRSETEQLVRAVLDTEVSPERHEAIVERSMGNPLFVEELVRLAQSRQDHELPLAIQSAFQGRLDCLPMTVKRGALVASVLGTTIWPDALAAMEPDMDVDAVLGALSHSEIVVYRMRARLGRRGEFLWRHALLRETAYAMLSQAELESLHGIAADWLTRAGEVDLAVLAEHHARAANKPRAAELFYASARSALREGANEAAIYHAERAINLAVLPAAPQAQAHSIAAAAAHRLGRYELGLSHSSLGLACEPGRATTLTLSAQRALTLRRFGRVDESIELLLRVLQQHTEAEDRTHAESWAARVFCELEFAWADIHRMRWDEAERRAERLLGELHESMDDALQLAVHHALAQALHGGEKLERALREHRLVVEKAEQLGLRWRAEGARVGLGQVLLALGLTNAAMRELTVAVDRSRAARLPSTEAFARHHLARALLRTGDRDGARQENELVSRLATGLQNPLLVAVTHAVESVIALLDQTFDQAERLATEALTHRHLPRGWRAAAIAVQACVLAMREEQREALDRAETAVVAMAEGGEDEGDEWALKIVRVACSKLNAVALSVRARHATETRFALRIARIADSALRANVRALELQVLGDVL